MGLLEPIGVLLLAVLVLLVAAASYRLRVLSTQMTDMVRAMVTALAPELEEAPDTHDANGGPPQSGVQLAESDLLWTRQKPDEDE